MTPAFGNSTAKCSMKARTHGSRPCRYGMSPSAWHHLLSNHVALVAMRLISHHHDKRSQAGPLRQGIAACLTVSMSFQRAGSLAVRRTQAMSTDGWQFSGDAVRFLQGGQRPRCVAHVRLCQPNSSRKLNAGADRWCRIR